MIDHPLLFTLGFAFVFVISTLTGAYSEPVVDWKGDPLKVDVQYEMWVVGRDKGPVAIGSSLNPVGDIHFVINKPYRKINPYLPDPVIFKSVNTSEKWVQVHQDYGIFQFGPTAFNYWEFLRSQTRPRRKKFIITDRTSPLDGRGLFQLELVDEVEHLYKLTTTVIWRKALYKADIMSQWTNGEDRLCLEGDSAVNIRFVEHKPVIQQVV